jgi:hypothetical protein
MSVVNHPDFLKTQIVLDHERESATSAAAPRSAAVAGVTSAARHAAEMLWLTPGEVEILRGKLRGACVEATEEGTQPDVSTATVLAVLVCLDELVEQRARAQGRTLPLEAVAPKPPPLPPRVAATRGAAPLTGRVIRASHPTFAFGVGLGEPSEVEVQLDGGADGTKIVGQDVSIFPKGSGYRTVKVLSVSVDQERHSGARSLRVSVAMDLPPGTSQVDGQALAREITDNAAALIFGAKP